nr:hypothetical protein CFP56_63552 [Quercus suber]
MKPDIRNTHHPCGPDLDKPCASQGCQQSRITNYKSRSRPPCPALRVRPELTNGLCRFEPYVLALQDEQCDGACKIIQRKQLDYICVCGHWLQAMIRALTQMHR